MTLEQVVECRRIHEGYNMTIFRTEGYMHHSEGRGNYVIWDDSKELLHAVSLNNNGACENGKITVDSSPYESFTNIFSKRTYTELVGYLKTLQTSGLINSDKVDEILDFYKIVENI